MSYDGYFEFNGRELFNLARTASLAPAMGVNTVVKRPSALSWIRDALYGPSDIFSLGFGLGPFGEGVFGGPPKEYTDVTDAPWFDAGNPISAEFAGFVPLSVRGLDDDSFQSQTQEFNGSGGYSTEPRSGTQALVFNVGLVGATERGVEYGYRWMNRVLHNDNTQFRFPGADLSYFKWAAADADVVHRRAVTLTRGSSITNKKHNQCSATWLVTFTLTANDPFTYGKAIPQISSIGGPTSDGAKITEQGTVTLTQEACPVYDYSPIYDPLYPALVPSPTVPNLVPDGWTDEEGREFRRKWARLEPVEPSLLNIVPMFTLTSDEAARMVRVSVWSADASELAQCGPLFTTVITYLPPDLPFYIDGEQRACYAWDGTGVVRRTDSLTYNGDATPVRWSAFNDPNGLMVTLDCPKSRVNSGYEGGTSLRAEVAFVPKTD